MESELIIGLDNTKRWYLNGKCHRIDGPAIIGTCGYQVWCLNGKRHRIDGPAVIHVDGPGEYWAFGVRYSSFEELIIGVVVNQ